MPPTSLQGFSMSIQLGLGQVIPFPRTHIPAACSTLFIQGQTPAVDQKIIRLRDLMNLIHRAISLENWIDAADYADAWYTLALTRCRQAQDRAWPATRVAQVESDRRALISALSERLTLAHILLRPGYECRNAREQTQQSHALGAIAVMRRVSKPLTA
jgi:hypothetical protein